MILDYDKLKDNFKNISEQLETEKDPVKIAMLKNDLRETKRFLNLMLNRKEYKIKRSEYNLYPYDEEYLKSLVDFLNTDAKKMYNLFYTFGNLHGLPVKNALYRPINEQYMDFYLNSFDDFTPTALYPVYKEMKDNGQIGICNNALKKGKTASTKMETSEDSFILFNNKNYEGILNVMSEVAEVDSLKGLENTKTIQNKKLSVFAYTYSFFYKMVYNDTFINLTDTYESYGLRTQGLKLLELIAECDYYSDILNRSADYKLSDDGYVIPSGSLRNINELRLMFSNALALAFYDLYKNDPKTAFEEVEKFKSMLGVASDKEILEYFFNNKTNMNSGMINTYNDYMRCLKK